jgi:hypothetical protein
MSRLASCSDSATAGPLLVVGLGGTLTAGGAFLNSSGSVTLHSPMLELAGGITGSGSTALLQVPGGTPYEVVTTVLGWVNVGDRLRVFVDPANPKDVLVPRD